MKYPEPDGVVASREVCHHNLQYICIRTRLSILVKNKKCQRCWHFFCIISYSGNFLPASNIDLRNASTVISVVWAAFSISKLPAEFSSFLYLTFSKFLLILFCPRSKYIHLFLHSNYVHDRHVIASLIVSSSTPLSRMSS